MSAPKRMSLIGDVEELAGSSTGRMENWSFGRLLVRVERETSTVRTEESIDAIFANTECGQSE